MVLVLEHMDQDHMVLCHKSRPKFQKLYVIGKNANHYTTTK